MTFKSGCFKLVYKFPYHCIKCTSFDHLRIFFCTFEMKIKAVIHNFLTKIFNKNGKKKQFIPELGSIPVPSAPKSITLPIELEEISTKSTSRGY